MVAARCYCYWMFVGLSSSAWLACDWRSNSKIVTRMGALRAGVCAIETCLCVPWQVSVLRFHISKIVNGNDVIQVLEYLIWTEVKLLMCSVISTAEIFSLWLLIIIPTWSITLYVSCLLYNFKNTVSRAWDMENCTMGN